MCKCKALFLFFFFWHTPLPVGSWIPHQGSNLGPLQWRCRVLTTVPPGKTLQCFFRHGPGRPPSLNMLALPRLTAMLLLPGFLLCVPTLTIHSHFCTNLPDTYFRTVCKMRWKRSRQARHLPLRAGSFLWSQFALASSHPSHPSERLPHSRLWLSSTSRITVVDLIWHFYHYSFLPISLSLVMESSVSRQPALTPHPTHAAWPRPAFVPGTLSHRPDLLAGFIRTAWPLVHDPQSFKPCAICPFPSRRSGRLSATCCQAPPVSRRTVGSSRRPAPTWQPLWPWRSSQSTAVLLPRVPVALTLPHLQSTRLFPLQR